jgi:GTPase SAR1 family protein
VKRVKPPFTPGLKAELMGRDRGLNRIRNFAEKSTRLSVVVFGPEGRGKTLWLRQG